ncbi:MAG: hypothetical protein CYG59_04935 [Chloroflexi bacterium]|nr:MAG: hypothetical protein CYG59_04935 [Chloroflexota bacterium]
MDHPLDLYTDQLGPQTITPAERIGEHVGQPVAVAGIVVAYRRIRTQQGRPMVFASFCDARGVTELTLFEQAAQQFAAILKAGSVVIACGTVQRDDERGVGVLCTRSTVWSSCDTLRFTKGCVLSIEHRFPFEAVGVSNS